MVNYHRMLIESFRDIKDASIVVYTEVKDIQKVSNLTNKLLNQLCVKYRTVTVYSNTNLDLENVNFILMNSSIKDIMRNVLYREHSYFIGFMKTNTKLYEDIIEYLGYSNSSYRIYDLMNNTWISR